MHRKRPLRFAADSIGTTKRRSCRETERWETAGEREERQLKRQRQKAGGGGGVGQGQGYLRRRRRRCTRTRKSGRRRPSRSSNNGSRSAPRRPAGHHKWVLPKRRRSEPKRESKRASQRESARASESERESHRNGEMKTERERPPCEMQFDRRSATEKPYGKHYGSIVRTRATRKNPPSKVAPQIWDGRRREPTERQPSEGSRNRRMNQRVGIE